MVFVENISKHCVTLDDSIRSVVACIDQGMKGIALVMDDQQQLLGTITDGDIRRAVLDGVSLNSPVQALLSRKKDAIYPKPVTAKSGESYETLLGLMDKYIIRQLPLLDETDRVIDLVTIEDLLPGEQMPMQAVVMAGGFGTRMRSLTQEIPKPMLPIGDRPLMERIVRQLQQTGIQRVHITTHYKAEKIKEHFADGHDFGVEINYVDEDRPLGTAGALGLMETPDQPLLVINGDIITRVDFRAMLSYHQAHQADLTLGVRQFELDVPYGVVECDGPQVLQLSEKPRYSFLVNAGVYLLGPSVYRHIPNGERFDMTDLISRLIENEGKVVSFPIVEYWLDIGEPENYEQAQMDMKNGKIYGNQS